MRVNPGYALGQLVRALTTFGGDADEGTRARAAEKVARWTRVIEGMVSGSIETGSRTPVAGVPAWATLEVVHGGFATGALLAGGALRDHERELLAQSDRGEAAGRAALNVSYLGEEGRQALDALLGSGKYRIDVAEEGALLVAAHLMARGEMERAETLLATIAPFFDRLRFYPVPLEGAPATSSLVHREDVGVTARKLASRRAQRQVTRMNESLSVWAPLHDRVLSLLLETAAGDAPLSQFPEGWHPRAQELIREIAVARRAHSPCRKTTHAKSSFVLLVGLLERAASPSVRIAPRDRSRARTIVAACVAKRGAPSSEQHARLRAEQARVAALPTHAAIAHMLATRLSTMRPDAGLASLEVAMHPVGAAESSRSGVPMGTVIPEPLARRLAQCLEASLDELVERGVITSGEVVAQLLPQVTSQIRAAGFADPGLRRLYAAIYSAFRRRRSLLLLDLDHQVKLEELPWVAALQTLRSVDADTRTAARAALAQVTELCVTAFPYALVPNKLLQELRTLVTAAELDAPLVDELAADIFMGTFSPKFLRAAQIAARLLSGTLYARYYDLPIAHVLDIDDVSQDPKHKAKSSPAFAALCVSRAPKGTSKSWVAANGAVIEQQQILTTQNLAALFVALDLRTTLADRLLDACESTFHWICRQWVGKLRNRHTELLTLKNTAYAWRQMVFLASLLDEPVRKSFLASAGAHLAARAAHVQARIAPALRGLTFVEDGGGFDGAGRGPAGARRFLGWSTGTHWMLEVSASAVQTRS